MNRADIENLVRIVVAALDERFRANGYDTKQAWDIAGPMLAEHLHEILAAQGQAVTATKQ